MRCASTRPSSATGCSGCPCPCAIRRPGAATCGPAAPSGWRSARSAARSCRGRSSAPSRSRPRAEPVIDLRSDTVTRPTAAMRAAIAAAEVGDDQYGEDPSVIALQERIAALLGKEAALLVPTGTMANQLALKLFCRPGDDVIVGAESHAVWHETGAAAAIGGIQFTEVGTDGRFTADAFLAARNPRDHLLYPPTTLVEVEDTQNRKGGLVWDLRRARADRRGRARARRRVLPRRRPAAQRGRGARRRPGGARRAVRPRLARALQGARLPRRLGARGHARRRRRARPLPPDARRRDAPGRRAGRRRAPRARPPRRPARARTTRTRA